MLVIKKNDQVKVCIDFQNLNVATLKYDYVMPIADMLIAAIYSHGILTFMDRYLGNNQIFVVEPNIHKKKLSNAQVHLEFMNE